MDFFSTQIGEVALVSGLEWRALTDPKTVDKEARAYSKDLEAKLYVSIKSEQNVFMCGFLPNEFAADAPKKPVSLPVVLAGLPNVAKDCVLVIDDGEGGTIAALLNGIPAAGFDGRGQIEDIVQAARDFIRLAPQGVAVYGNCTELQPEPLELSDLVETSTTLKQAQLRKLPTSPLVKIAILGVVLLAVGAAAKVGFSYQDELKKQAAARLANVNPDVAYANAVTPLFAAMNPAVASVSKIKELLAPVAMSGGGWELVQISCGKDSCSYNWQNAVGTNKTFVVPPQAKNMMYSPKGDVASYSLSYPKPLPIGLDVQKTLTVEEVWRDVVGDFQQFVGVGVGRDFGVPAEFNLPGGVTGTPSKPYKEGAYSISGPWITLDALQRLPVASTFESLQIAIDSQKHVTYKLTGKYYVQ